ncbi:DinB superfamily protein [Salegentibacter holothuriorum]|uniref:DinB superfamily protein n=1 Tax=Salegentibacter holothuriorum TaxID=241145 RepID=A0A1T5AFF8_9FLAO|nr:DinB family protein [Salegentibacter holothuriorum]SKB33656.1 DinB superfamily protein [Salegentibacter holothuriorum]
MIANSLNSDEYNAYYNRYLKKIPGNLELGILLLENKEEFLSFLNKIKPEDLTYSYAEGKWTVAEVIQHLIDVERIFQYRSLTLARDPGIKLPGFDHDAYVPASSTRNRDIKSFKNEFKAVRDSGICLYRSFSEEMLLCKGFVSGSSTSCRALGFIAAGHTKHHIELFKENYNIV